MSIALQGLGFEVLSRSMASAPGEQSFCGAAVAAALVAGSVVVLALTLPQAPATFNNAWGFAPEGAPYTAIPLRQVTRLEAGAFLQVSRACLVLAWASWLALLLLLPYSGRRERAVVAAVSIAALAFAVVSFPPVLSRDVLGYVAYGRVAGVHGLNPYTHGRDALAAVGDPTAIFLIWDTPLPYGPLWVLVASAISAIGLHLGGTWTEVLLHKLLAAIALAACAGAVTRLRSMRWERAVGTILLNPLLLIEGPGTGHNDVFMMALVLAAAALFRCRRMTFSYLALGSAIAVKPVAAVCLPFWIATHWLRDGKRVSVSSWLYSAAAAGLPTILLSLPFGGPPRLIAALSERALATGASALTVTVVLLGGASSAAVLFWKRSGSEGATALDNAVPVLLAVSLAVPVSFPWYQVWPTLAAIAVNSQPLLWISLTTTVSIVLMLRYVSPL